VRNPRAFTLRFPGSPCLPSHPTAETGEKIVQSQVEALGQMQAELLAGYRPIDGWQPPNQDQVEEMWHRFDRATRKYWRTSGAWAEYKSGPPPFPGWDAIGL